MNTTTVHKYILAEDLYHTCLYHEDLLKKICEDYVDRLSQRELDHLELQLDFDYD